MYAPKPKRYRKRPTTTKNPTVKADKLHSRLQSLLFDILNATDDVKKPLIQMLMSDATDEMRYERWNQLCYGMIDFIEAPMEDEFDGRLT